MLISIVIQLRAVRPALLRLHMGRANQAVVLGLLNSHDPALAAQAHAGNGPRALTVSGLRGVQASADRVHLRAGDLCSVRVTGLTEAVSRALAKVFLTESPPLWDLEGCTFEIVHATCSSSEDSWAGMATCEELAAAVIQGRRRMNSSITLAFASPVTFKAGQADDLHIPLPLPALVFGSLADRWNTFSAVQLDTNLRQFADQRVAISQYRLMSEMIPQKNRGLRVGGKGEVTYEVLEKDPYWLSVLNILADFALYSGVGAQSATGMGQVRRTG